MEPKMHAIKDLERAILCLMILNEENVATVEKELTPNDFYHDNNGILCQAIFNVYDRVGTVDLLLVEDELSRTGLLDKVGGIKFLIELQQDIPSLGVLDAYIKTIKSYEIV
jgi:replicative DNA helicase